MNAVIHVAGLTKRFDRGLGLAGLFRARPQPGKMAVDEVSLDVKEGEVFGLLGPNGAGKTTLIKMLCTLLLPSSGTAVVCGYDVVQAARRVRETIGLVASDERSFYWRLTGRQNLRFFAALHGLHGKAPESVIEELAELLNLRDVLDQRFAEYSTGMRQRLAIARGLIKRPRVLFMDEPTKGVDPLNTQALLTLIRDGVAGHLGKTILITTHMLSEAEQICDRVAIMDRGRIMACGTTGELRRMVKTDDHYLLAVGGLDEAALKELADLPDVTACTMRPVEGAVVLDIRFEYRSPAFSSLIERIVGRDGRVLSCSRQSSSFEEIFRDFFHQRNFPGPTGRSRTGAVFSPNHEASTPERT